MTKNLKAGAVYFALAFGAGFVLGVARVLWLVPRFGARNAELLEAPVMLLVSVAAARWTVRRLEVPPSAGSRLAVGLVALALLLAMEFGVVLWIRGLSLADYVAHRDPVSGAVYIALLATFAVLPLLVARGTPRPA